MPAMSLFIKRAIIEASRAREAAMGKDADAVDDSRGQSRPPDRP
jgi:hypothetical protein